MMVHMWTSVDPPYRVVSCCTCERVRTHHTASYLWMRRVAHMNESCTHMHESWCTLPKIRRGLTAGVRGLLVAARDTAHVWIWHVVFVKEVWQTYECVMLHKCEWIITCGCVMSYLWRTDVEDENDLCHTSKCVWRKLGKFELGTAFPKGLTHKQMNACSIKLNKCLIKSTIKIHREMICCTTRRQIGEVWTWDSISWWNDSSWCVWWGWRYRWARWQRYASVHFIVIICICMLYVYIDTHGGQGGNGMHL